MDCSFEDRNLPSEPISEAQTVWFVLWFLRYLCQVMDDKTRQSRSYAAGREFARLVDRDW